MNFASYYNQKFKYWTDRGINGPKPRIFVGNLLDAFKRSVPENDMENAKKYGKMYGIYLGTEPMLVLLDNEVIKDVMIKDFHCFADRPKFNVLHEMLNNNLFDSEGEKWKRMRIITTPSFTSGKLRAMVPLMENCIDKFVAYFDKAINEQDGVIDVKKVTAGFTIDVIASTSFATDTNANDDRSGENAFVENGRRLFQIGISRIVAILLFPVPLLRLLNIKSFQSPKPFEFFVDLAKEIVRQRKATKSKRNDLVQLMMDAYVDEKDLNNTDYQHLSTNMNNGK